METQVTLRAIKSLPKEDLAMGSPLSVSLCVSLSLSVSSVSVYLFLSVYLTLSLCLCVCLYLSTIVGTPGMVLEAPSHLRRAEE